LTHFYGFLETNNRKVVALTSLLSVVTFHLIQGLDIFARKQFFQRQLAWEYLRICIQPRRLSLKLFRLFPFEQIFQNARHA